MNFCFYEIELLVLKEIIRMGTISNQFFNELFFFSKNYLNGYDFEWIFLFIKSNYGFLRKSIE